MQDNLILLTDSYKVSHSVQYPPGTTKIYSYFESRGGEFKDVVFFGLQYFLKRYLEGKVITRVKIEEAEEYYALHLGPGVFNKAGWEHILNKYGGCLPIRIKAVPEGTVVPTSNVMMTVENNDDLQWLTNYIETLLVQVWYPSTVATISREQKKVILAALEKSGDPALVGFKLHDFGCRGVETMESAGIGGCAHLVNFQGTDTIPALKVAKEYYNCQMAGFSIPAMEHSTVTAWGKSKEVDAFRNMLKHHPKGLVACVSDSWDFRYACDEYWGKILKSEVLEREGTVVIRPDSGDPAEEDIYGLNSLFKSYGGETNEKGYKVLDSHVRMIQGDGIDRRSLKPLLDAIMDAGFSADNIAFGSGGGLLQDCNRDTQKFAFKASYAEVNGVGRDVFKMPATAHWKSSKKGRLVLLNEDGAYSTEQETYGNKNQDQLVEVFNNGDLMVDYCLDEIRERAAL